MDKKHSIIRELEKDFREKGAIIGTEEPNYRPNDLVQLFYTKIGYHIPNERLLWSLLDIPLKYNIAQFNRLEFWGDTILTYYLTKLLLTNNHHLSTGDLSVYRSTLISREFMCYHIIPQLQIFDLLRFHEEEIYQEKNISNILEILIALIYLYHDNTAAESFITLLYSKHLVKEKQYITTSKKYKSLLQEYIQQDPESKIDYENIAIKTVNRSNEKFFIVKLKVTYFNREWIKFASTSRNYKASRELVAYIMYHNIKANTAMGIE